MNENIIPYIKHQKNVEYNKTINSFIELYLEFVSKNENIFCYNLDFDDEYILRFYATMSTDVIRSFFDILVDRLEVNKKFKIFASRKTDNEISSRFSDLNITMYVYNLQYDYVSIRNFFKEIKIDKYKNIIILYECIHKLVFSDMYARIDSYYIPKLLKLRNEISKYSFIKNTSLLRPNKNVDIVRNNKFLRYITKNQRLQNFIFIGRYILDKIYSYGTFGGYYDIIYIGHYSRFISNLRDRLKARNDLIIDDNITKSDSEIRNYYINIYKKKNNKLLARIYNGINHCFPQVKIRGVYVGTVSLILKYIINDIIMDGGDIKEIYKLFMRINFNKELFGDICIGKPISPYTRYRGNIFGSRPWEYKKTIGIVDELRLGGESEERIMGSIKEGDYYYYGSSIDIDLGDDIMPYKQSFISDEYRVYVTNNKCYALLHILDIYDVDDISINYDSKGDFIVMTELNKGAFKDSYRNKSGYIYLVDSEDFTVFNNKSYKGHEYSSDNIVSVIDKESIDNVWDEIIEYEKKGVIKLHYR